MSYLSYYGLQLVEYEKFGMMIERSLLKVKRNRKCDQGFADTGKMFAVVLLH